MSFSPHHSALEQLSQLLRENEHQSTLAAGWSQSPHISFEELQKQQPSKGVCVGSGVGSGVGQKSAAVHAMSDEQKQGNSSSQ